MKNKLRIHYKSFDKSSYSKLLVQKLKENDFYKNSKNIMIFYTLKNEVNLLELLEDNTKNFFLPKINNDTLCCCPYCKDDELISAKFNTFEPKTEPFDKNLIDLIIVPALCCDKNGYRIGYGGGYYDKFLKDCTGIKVACLPKQLVFESIYPEEFDIKMDYIITD